MKIAAGAIVLLAIIWTSASIAAPDFCKRWGGAAFDIAEQRVVGKPLSDVMAGIDTLKYNRFSDFSVADQTGLRSSLRDLAIGIYDSVMWSKGTFPEDMRDVTELACYKGRQ